MRLIDERAVVERLETVYNLRGEVKSEALQAIDMCKTIEAIPVEWLKEQRERMKNWGAGSQEQAIIYVLYLWETSKKEGRS